MFRVIRRSILASSFLFCSGEIRADPFGDWKTECIGRYRLDLPSDIRFTVASRDYFLNLSDARTQYDDLPAIAVNPINFLSVSAPMSVTEFETFQTEYKSRVASDRVHFKNGARDVVLMHEYPLTVPQAFAWQEERSKAILVYLYRAGRLYFRGISASRRLSPEQEINIHFKDRIDEDLARKRLADFLGRFRSREAFEVPKEAGICFPFAFIADGDTSKPDLDRDAPEDFTLAVDMVPTNHPDLVIQFEDAASAPSNFSLADGLPPPIEQIWKIRFAFDTPKIQLGLPMFHSFTMAGLPAKWGFGKMIHFDKTVDYGYAAAAVNEDKSSPLFEQSLSLLVIRHAAKTKDAPLTKEEVKDTAEKIATSITRR